MWKYGKMSRYAMDADSHKSAFSHASTCRLAYIAIKMRTVFAKSWNMTETRGNSPQLSRRNVIRRRKPLVDWSVITNLACHRGNMPQTDLTIPRLLPPWNAAHLDAIHQLPILSTAGWMACGSEIPKNVPMTVYERCAALVCCPRIHCCF